MWMDPERLQGGRADWALLRRAWRFVAPYKFQLIGFLFLMSLTAVIAVLPPQIVRLIVDQALPHRDMGQLIQLLAVMAGLYLLTAAMTVVASLIGISIGTNTVLNLRRAVYDHVQHMPIGFFSYTQTGKLLSRLNQDVETANNLFTGTLGSLLADVLTIAFTVAAMFAMSWQVTVGVLLLVPIFLGGAELVGRRTRFLTREIMKQWGELAQVTSERFNVAGAVLVKLFGRYSDELEGYAGRARKLQRLGVQNGVISIAFIAVLTFLGSMTGVLVFGIGGAAVIGGTLTLGAVVALSSYVQRVYTPIVDLASTRISLISGLVAVDRVFEVLDAPHAVTDAPDAVELVKSSGDVEFRDVWFRYPAAAGQSIKSPNQTMRRSLAARASDWILRGISHSLHSSGP